MTQYRTYGEILKEKEQIVINILKKAMPASAVSLKEGVLLLAANPDKKFNKIYRLHDRIACIISGSRADFKPVYGTLRFGVEQLVQHYSEGDVVLEAVAEEFARLLKERFEDVRIIAPYAINIALVEVAPVQEDDILIQIDFKGNLKDFASYLVLVGDELEASGFEKKIEGRSKETIEEIFSFIAEWDKGLRQANKGRLETVFLSREKVIKGEFGEVFQRLDFKTLVSKGGKK